MHRTALCSPFDPNFCEPARTEHWDAVGCVWSEGAVSVASASRGVWRYDPKTQTWTQVGAEPVAALTAQVALGTRGTVWVLDQGEGSAPSVDAGGTVHLALSFHANLYHSYRGDTNDEKGYGTDIRIMRATLDWLDAYPEVRGEWDLENAFSLDDVLPREAPDIIERIKARVEAGTGAVLDCLGEAGEWEWVLDDIQQIEPFPVKGRLGLYDVTLPEDLKLIGRLIKNPDLLPKRSTKGRKK